MKHQVSRRRFMAQSLAASAVPALAASFEEQALLARAATETAVPAPAGKLQQGRIGDIKISRLICGGNLISGFAHSRDLIYVSPLLKHYFTDKKVYETLALCEESGINTAILRVDRHTIGLYTTYTGQEGGKIQWVAQAKPSEKNSTLDFQLAVDNGACMVYVHGGVADRMAADGKLEFLGKCLDSIRDLGVQAGLGAHQLATVKACEKAGLKPDFYMKTLNAKNYWSAGPKEKCDNIWSETPEETIAYMKAIKVPWIAYKVLGAGAIHPREGFKYVFENGADFACVGMFDFQVVEDVVIARRTIQGIKQRSRPWCG